MAERGKRRYRKPFQTVKKIDVRMPGMTGLGKAYKKRELGGRKRQFI